MNWKRNHRIYIKIHPELCQPAPTPIALRLRSTCFDTEFIEWSNKLIDEILAGERLSVLYDITIDEIQDGPEHVRKKMDIKY